MKIMYHMPYVDSMNAGRTIYHGYKNAFTDLGHHFYAMTAGDRFSEKFDQVCPDIFMTSLRRFNLRFIDLPTVKRHRSRGMKVYVNTPFWRSPFDKFRINESGSLKDDKRLVKLIKEGDFGDLYYNCCEDGDPRMDGFERETGRLVVTIPLAADKIALKGEYRQEFVADVSYIGTYLPEKAAFFQKNVFPLHSKYSVRLYGQDWTWSDRMLGWAQKLGQYFHAPVLKDIRKPRLRIEDEGHIYASSVISINVHEEYQKRFGRDCNERTFKIPLCNGFEITDDVACIRKYFKDEEEIMIARNDNDFLEKLEFFLKNPEKRLDIIQRGRERVLSDHTYHNRAQELLAIYNRY